MAKASKSSYVELTIKIDNPEDWCGIVIGGPADLPEQHKVINVPEFKDLEAGTLVKAQARVSKSGIVVASFEVVEDGTVYTAGTQGGPTDEYEGWKNVSGTFFSPEEFTIFSALDDMLPANLLITGPSGYGKTARAKAWAEYTSKGYHRVDVGGHTDPEDFFGTREARGGTTIFEETPFTLKFVEGKKVLLLDEVNRAPAWVLNNMYGLLDDERGTTIMRQTYMVGEDVFFILTANVGAAFAGTFTSDRALLNRMDAHLKVVPPPRRVEIDILTAFKPIEEEVAAQIVDTLSEIRRSDVDTVDLDVSTRTAKKIAKLYDKGIPLRNCFENLVVGTAPEDSRKTVLDIMKLSLGSEVNWG